MDSQSIAPIVITFPREHGTVEADNPMRGTAHPNGEVFIGNVPSTGVKQAAKVDANGNWEKVFPGTGPQKVSFEQVVNGQIHSRPGDFSFTVAGAPPIAPKFLQPTPEADLGPKGAFMIEIPLYTESDESALEISYAGGSVIISQNMGPDPASNMSRRYLILDKPLDVGYYSVRARYKSNGVWSRYTAETNFSVGMPTG